MKRTHGGMLVLGLGLAACAPEIGPGSSMSSSERSLPLTGELKVAKELVDGVKDLVNTVGAKSSAPSEETSIEVASKLYFPDATIFPLFLKDKRGPEAFVGLLNFLKDNNTPLEVVEVCAIWVTPSSRDSLSWVFPNIARRGTDWLLVTERMVAQRAENQDWKIAEHDFAAPEQKLSGKSENVSCSSEDGEISEWLDDVSRTFCKSSPNYSSSVPELNIRYCDMTSSNSR